MSTPPKKQSSTLQQDKSDILSLLESIERLYVSYQTVLNTYTQTSLLLSIAIEAQTLLMKLRVVQERWTYHLPFKEACMVDFYEWAKNMKKMSRSLVVPEERSETNDQVHEYCPSKHFVLDLYEMLSKDEFGDASVPYFHEESVSKFLSAQDKIRKEVTKHWNTYKYKFSELIARSFDGHVAQSLSLLADKSVVIRMVCSEVLQQLSAVLYQLYEMPPEVIKRDQFARLAERVVNETEYGGVKAQAAARRDVRILKNSTPENQWEQRCEDEVKASIDVINEMKYGRKVFTFIGQNYDITSQYAGLGRFLNSVRCDISDVELGDLIWQLFRIRYFHEELEKMQAAALAELSAATEASGEPAAKDALSVYMKRKAVKPLRPRLPDFFNVNLVTDPEATTKFYDILHHCGFYIGRTLLSQEKADKNQYAYKGWKWKHLREALSKMKLIDPFTPKAALAEYLVEVFPYLEFEAVKRGFNNRGGQLENATTDERIIKEIQNEFETLTKMLK